MSNHKNHNDKSRKQSRLQARVMQHFPGKPFTMDNYNSLQLDSVCSGPFPSIFGFEPRSMEESITGYLGTDAPARPI